MHIKECIAITYGTTKNASNHITRFSVRGKLTISNRECNSSYMVGNNTHCDIDLLIIAIFFTANLSYFLYYSLKQVGVIIRLSTLNGHTQPLEAHSCIDNLCRKLFE